MYPHTKRRSTFLCSPRQRLLAVPARRMDQMGRDHANAVNGNGVDSVTGNTEGFERIVEIGFAIHTRAAGCRICVDDD